MGLFDGLKAQAAALPQYAQPQRTGLLGGIQDFLKNNRGPGGTIERLNMFGAQLQDTYAGGNRAAGLSQQRQEMQTQAEAARQRQQLNQLAGSIEMTPAQRLLFQADPERWAALQAEIESPYTVGDQRVRNGEVLYDAPDDPQYFNTARGIYKADGDNFNPMVEFEPDPLEQELLRARIAATNAQVGQRDAAAARARRPAAAPRSSGGGARPAPVNPNAVRWD